VTESSDPPPSPPELPGASPAPEPPAPPVSTAPPPGDLSGFPPPPGPSKIAGLGKFTGGCLVTILLGFLLAITVFSSDRKPSGCAIAQLVYILPALIILFRKRQAAWAFGIVFGGAIVVFLASICGDMTFH